MKNSIVKLQGYFKTLVTTLLLTMGVSSARADYYLDISNFTSWTPEQDGCYVLWDGSNNVRSTYVAANLYKFTTSNTPTTLYFKRKDSGSNEFSVTRSTTYNVYKVTGWNAGSCANYNIDIVTKTNYIYFDNSVTDWSNTYKYFVIGHDKPSAYSKVYSLSAISDTKLLYVAQSADNWSDATYYGFLGNNSTYSSGSWGTSSYDDAAKYVAPYTNKYDMNSGSSYWCTPSSATNNKAFTISAGTSTVNATQGAKHRNTTSDSYSTITGTGSFPATLNLKGTYLSGNGTSAQTVISASAANAGSSKLTYSAVKTGLITHTYESLSEDYQFDGWGTGSTPSSTSSSYSYNISSATTIYAFFTRKWQVTFGKGGTSGTSTVTATAGGSSISSGTKVVGGSEIVVTATPATGYEIIGWYSNATCTTPYTSGSGGVTISADKKTFTLAGSSFSAAKTIYVKIMPKTYTITLSYSGQPHYGSAGGSVATSVTATYGEAMPALTASGKLPTGTTYYGFAGYYSEENGEGTKYYNTDGSSARNWDYDGDKTLYAYFKQPNIAVSLSPSNTVNPSVSVTATPTLDLKAVTGTTSFCWKLLYSNGNPVSPATSFTPGANYTVTFTTPSTSGTYKLATILRTGSGGCGTGDVIDSIATSLYVAPSHTVTVRYVCGDEVIQASTTIEGDPINWTSISAPDIFGFTFSSWVAGDGITLESSATTKNNRFKANYDGNLTARYTRKKMIFLKNTLGWSQPYVYFYKSGGYWDASTGAGCNGDQCWNKNTALAMTRIGSSDVWYYDYSGQSWADNVTNEIAFTSKDQHGYASFYSSNEVIYGTSYSAGYSAGTPMFVPLSKSNQSADAVNGCSYYSRGYWIDYLGSYAGYTLLIYNSAGDQVIKRERFTSEDKLMTMKATVDLEAGTTYQYEVLRNDGIYCKNTETLSETNKGPKTLIYTGVKGKVQANAAGNYTFTIGYDKTSLLNVSLSTPVATGDFRITYTDNDTWGRGVAHVKRTWILPSKTIKARANGVDTISFFVSKGHSPEYRWQKATAVAAGSVTWGTSGTNAGAWTGISVSESGVYNFRVVQDGSKAITSITNIGKYTGNYYIRTDACNSKWDHYATDPDNQMTYTEFSMSADNPGDKYSHYNCQWSPRGTNIKFCIANDYSPCISDTLTKDNPNTFDNIDDYGFLKSDGAADPTRDKYSANVRFMWNETTNIIKRAYVGSATTPERQYLVLKGCGSIKTSDGEDFGGEGEDVNKALFHDDQDFIYERIITIQPTTRAKVYASYVTTDLSKAQYFRGAYDGGACGSTTNSIQIIGGSGSLYYKVRVIYDFKTNRLICAWMPNGTDVGDLDVQADVMVIRDHQQGAEAITFSSGGKLDDVKYVYGVMRFNRWTLNNRARGLAGADDQDPDHCRTPEAISTYHPVLPIAEQTSIYERALYFISFPFDVQLSEVFGLGTYGTHWVISRYNGLRRAQEGYFQDNCFNSDCTNWDYIWDRKGVTLNANEGYLLSLEVDSMLYDNNVFWVNNISQKELYFPSKEKMNQITTTEVTIPALGDEYQCTKNYDFDGTSPIKDRRVYDSYWRCIGTPSYAPYGAVIKKDDGSGPEVTWQTNYTWRADFKDFPFLYEWNVDDNSLSAQSTKKFLFKPMHSYLAQNGNAMYWTAVSATPSSIVRRQRRAVDEDGDYYWRVILSRGEKEDDQAYVRMSDDEQVTDTFDFGQDLSKEFNYGHSDIYTYIGQTRAAANSMPVNTETTTIIPLGLNIWATGYHTISMPDGGDGVGVELVDLYNGERVNLSAGFCYSFMAEKGIIEDRFQLEISPVKGTHTGIENVNVESADESKARKVLIDGALYIVRDGKLYDARGARIK